ncbi:MAG: hypothetical protein R3C03_16395 [Pirellulaceae bacterium]
MKLTHTFFVLMLFLSSNAYCQDFETDSSATKQSVTNSLNLRLQTMQIALSEIENFKSDLELVDSQRQSLESLSMDYVQMVESLMKLEKENAESDEAIELCLRKMEGFEDRLSNEILLPHQNSELRKMVFAKLVSENDDDWFETLTIYYPAEFQLTERQKQKMKKIKSSTSEQIEKAKREFDEKLKDIREAAKAEIQDVLTPKQSEILAELSGHANR